MVFFIHVSVVIYGQSGFIDSLSNTFKEVQDFLFYRNHDSTYIKSYVDQWAVRIVAANKYNYFNIRDGQNGTNIRFMPNYGINLGAGVAYKWFAVDLTFRIGIKGMDDFESSEFLDFQGRVFSSKQYLEGSLQYYFGHKINNIGGINVPVGEIDRVRDDIRTINIGLSYLYAFNYDKFSLKAPFILNEVQRKSAGSFIFGASFDFFNMNADSSVIPSPLAEYFDEQLHLVDISTISLAANFGYMYTFSWKERFFLTLGLIPGLNFNLGDSKAENRENFKWNVSYKIKAMNAIGYNGERFFTGIQLIGDLNNVRLFKKGHTAFNYGHSKVFIGYRFRKSRKGKG